MRAALDEGTTFMTRSRPHPLTQRWTHRLGGDMSALPTQESGLSRGWSTTS